MAEREEGVLDGGDSALPPNDAEDYAAWVSPHLPVLAALAVREVGTVDADDVVQEALVRAWRRRSTYRPDRGSPRAWLVGVLLDQARRHRVRRRPGAIGPVEPAVAAGVERLDVEDAVRALPRRQREVITLYYLADLSVAEVGDVLGISVGSVKSQLHDARVALHSALEEQ